MTMMRRRRGQIGEAAAAAFLQEQGYRLIKRNYQCPLGEIDIIAQDGDELVFVEVRARSSSAFGTPQETIDWRKRQRLRHLASYYLSRHGTQGNRPCRFDVLAVRLDRSERVKKIEHIRGAF